MPRALAQAGADVVIWGSNGAKNADAEARLKSTGVNVLTQVVNVADEAAVQAGMAKAVEQMGRIDTVIANAGIGGGARSFSEFETETYRRVLSVNLDGVFLSVDIDVCDPGHAPGTGTPEPGGLTARELLDAVRRLAYELPLVGIDIVEVSPPYDSADITAALANRVALEVLSATARKRLDAATGATWDRAQPLLADRVTDVLPD